MFLTAALAPDGQWQGEGSNLPCMFTFDQNSWVMPRLSDLVSHSCRPRSLSLKTRARVASVGVRTNQELVQVSRDGDAAPQHRRAACGWCLVDRAALRSTCRSSCGFPGSVGVLFESDGAGKAHFDVASR